MSQDPIYVLESKTDDQGVVSVRRQLYRPPEFPVREYIICERESRAAIMVCPGTHEIERPSENPAPYGTPTRRQRGERAPVKDVCHGYRPLRNPADLMHATPMTQEEAFAFAKSHGFVLAENCPPGAHATHQLIAV